VVQYGPLTDYENVPDNHACCCIMLMRTGTGLLIVTARVPDDAVAFFGRCAKGLKPGGIIIVKENICKEGFIVDKVPPALQSPARSCTSMHQCK
jgi:hypothetical protein